ncbi:MAG: crotonase/enoyl-CoA hydratase family protein [Aquabacterium sp.]|jgi:enoyl-CoA hydratase/carnithine racemase|nr:crotonase/enoyl-CoA hydratase family protein [Aquabacterium sp.]
MSFIETSQNGHILEIKVNRADKHNALSPEMYQDLARAYGELSRNPELRVGLLYADGKHFTSGIELDKWAPIFASGQGFTVAEGEVDPFGLNGERHRKPVVMAVQGNCFTWGVEILLNTEVRVASEDTRFAMLEVKRGIFPCGGATLRLPQQMGWANAQRYLLTGDAWSAQEALRLGLVQELTAPGEQVQKAREIAEKIAKAAPLGVQNIVKSTRMAWTQGEQEAAKHLFTDMLPVMQSQDAAEGVRSFMERREAVFTGR